MNIQLKRILGIVLCLSLLCTFFGCGEDAKPISSSSTPAPSSSQAAPPSDAPQSEPEESSEPEPVESEPEEVVESEPEYDPIPEVIDTLEICELDEDGNYVPFESMTGRRPEQVFLAINSEIGNWPVKWSSSDDMSLNIDENGVITTRRHGENPIIIDRSYNVIITATLPTNDSVSVLLSTGIMGDWGYAPDPVLAPQGIKYWSIYETLEYKLVKGSSCSNLVIPLTEKTFQLSVSASFVGQLELTDMDKSDPTNNSIHQIYEDDNTYTFIETKDLSDLNIIWESSDPSVASVDKSGLVTLHKKGRTLITAVAKDEFRGKRYSDQEWLDYIYVNVE